MYKMLYCDRINDSGSIDVDKTRAFCHFPNI